MVELSADDERDDTHFWVFCPGCAYSGKIGVPHNYPADVVVCPNCRQVIHVRPEDRILWRPAGADEFLRQRFPHLDWDNIDRAPRPSPVAGESPNAGGNPPAAALDEPVVVEKPAPLAERYRARPGNSAAVWICAAVAAGALLMTLVTAIAHRPPRRWERHDRRVAVRNVDSRKLVDRDAAVNVNPLPPMPPLPLPPPQSPTQKSPPKSPASESLAPQKPLPPAEVPAAPPELAWRELFEHARQRMEEGDYVQAVEDLNEVLRLKPDCTEALVQRMRAYFELGRYREALADANRQLRLRPNSSRAFVSRAVVYEAIGNWRQVADDLDRAVRLAEADLDAVGQDQARAALDRSQRIVTEIYSHARKLFAEHKYSEAAELFTVLLRHRPDTAKLVFWRAACYEAMGAVDQALLDYNHALALPSPPAWAYVRRAMLHERKLDFAAAVIDMRKAVGLEPERRDYIDRLRRLEIRKRYQPQMRRIPFRAKPLRTRV